MLNISMGDYVLAREHPYAFGHLAANDVQLCLRQLLEDARHYLGSKPKHGIQVWGVLEPSDKKAIAPRAMGRDPGLGVVNHRNESDPVARKLLLQNLCFFGANHDHGI